MKGTNMMPLKHCQMLMIPATTTRKQRQWQHLMGPSRTSQGTLERRGVDNSTEQAPAEQGTIPPSAHLPPPTETAISTTEIEHQDEGDEYDAPQALSDADDSNNNNEEATAVAASDGTITHESGDAGEGENHNLEVVEEQQQTREEGRVVPGDLHVCR